LGVSQLGPHKIPQNPLTNYTCRHFIKSREKEKKGFKDFDSILEDFQLLFVIFFSIQGFAVCQKNEIDPEAIKCRPVHMLVALWKEEEPEVLGTGGPTTFGAISPFFLVVGLTPPFLLLLEELRLTLSGPK